MIIGSSPTFLNNNLLTSWDWLVSNTDYKLKTMRTKTLHFILLLFVNLLLAACGNTNSSSSGSNESIIEEIEEWEDCDNCNGRGYFTY